MYLKAVLAFNSSQLSLFSGCENGRYDNVGLYCHFNGIPLQKLRDIQICRGRFKSLKTWDFAECFFSKFLSLSLCFQFWWLLFLYQIGCEGIVSVATPVFQGNTATGSCSLMVSNTNISDWIMMLWLCAKRLMRRVPWCPNYKGKISISWLVVMVSWGYWYSLWNKLPKTHWCKSKDWLVVRNKHSPFLVCSFSRFH